MSYLKFIILVIYKPVILKEKGEKGYLLVEGDESKLQASFKPTQYIRFEKAVIETQAKGKHALYEAIQKFKDSVRTEGKAFIN